MPECDCILRKPIFQWVLQKRAERHDPYIGLQETMITVKLTLSKLCGSNPIKKPLKCDHSNESY